MKFPSHHISLLVFMLLFRSTILNHVVVHAHRNCDFPAIINLGDSNSDTGGYSVSLGPINSPYGDTYFHMPAGRLSDGRLLIDFIAEAFGLPFLNAYLDSLGTNFSHGINFAAASSTIRLPKSIRPNGRFSPFYLDLQYSQFVQFKSRSEMIRKQGNLFASLMPSEDHFSKALYTIDIGQNDLAEGFLANLTIENVNASVPDIVNKFSANVKNLYSLGGRSFWIHNTGPIGCLPYMLTPFSKSSEKDSTGCLKPHNEVAQYFNLKLKEAVTQLRNEFPLAAFTYVDIHSVKYSLFAKPQKYGFKLPLVTCCGYGGQYNFRNDGICGSTITVNGTKTIVGSCEDPLVRVVWDGVHYTEAANILIFYQISTGSFSDPPVPLKQACHRTLN